MRKFIIRSLVIVFFAGVFTSSVFAQEFESSQGQENETYNLLIEVEEALDQIEKNFDPAVVTDDAQEDAILEENNEIEELGTEIIVPVDEETISGAGEPLEIGSPDVEEEEEGTAGNEVEPGEELQVKVIPLLHAEASSLIETLNGMKSPSGEISYNDADRTLILKDMPAQVEAMSSFVKEVDILLETEKFKLKHVRAGDIIADIKTLLTANVGEVQYNEENNEIIAADTPLKIGKIKELIKILDRMDIGVSIEARALQVVLNDEHLDGVDWEAIVSEYQSVASSDKEKGNAPPLSLGTISQEDYDILLEALDTVGVVSTVSKESIRTENGAAKTISSPALSQHEEGVQFRITPLVNADQSLEISIKTSENVWEDVTVQMKSGETIVIGGLFEDVMVASTWKIPLLGDLPLLGFVFRSEGQQSRKAEVIVFLTVKTVKKKKL